MKIEKFLSRSPVVPILLANRQVESQLKQGLERVDLSVWEALILLAIFFEERPCRPMEIAPLLQMSRSQVSQSVKRLIGKGLLQRELDQRDARGIALTLTAKGRRAAHTAVEAFSRTTDWLELSLSERQSEEIASKLFSALLRRAK